MKKLPSRFRTWTMFFKYLDQHGQIDQGSTHVDWEDSTVQLIDAPVTRTRYSIEEIKLAAFDEHLVGMSSNESEAMENYFKSSSGDVTGQDDDRITKLLKSLM